MTSGLLKGKTKENIEQPIFFPVCFFPVCFFFCYSLIRSIFDIDDHHHILDDYNSDSDEDHDNEYSDTLEPKEDFSLRIFYCSRTHSQLAQFVKEIQKTEFAADIRLVSLASRSNMCINDSVLSLKNNSMINERCLELQKKKPKLSSELPREQFN